MTEYEENLVLIAELDKIGIHSHDEKLPLYKYTSIDSARLILSDHCFRFSPPRLFNDPFEMNYGLLDFDFNLEEFRNHLVRMITKRYPLFPRQELEYTISTFSKTELVEQHKIGLEKIRDKAMVLCLSEERDVTLMWSHYANNHSGICIGVRVPLYKEGIELNTLKVHYAGSIKPYKVMSGERMEQMRAFFYWVFTKSKVWEYEKEVRVFIPNINDELKIYPDDLYGYLRFPIEDVCEIYYGVSTPQRDIDDVENIISSKGYTIEKRGKFEINEGTFDLRLRMF